MLRALSKRFLNSVGLGLSPLPWGACSEPSHPLGGLLGVKKKKRKMKYDFSQYTWGTLEADY